MAAKYQLMTELYQRTGKTVTRNPQAWQGFLSSACRNYKCRFDEQLLIYAQRPDATACAEMELWNEKMRRWVKAGSKGIALIRGAETGRPHLEYVFDVADTRPVRGARMPYLWEMREEHHAPVLAALENRYGQGSRKELGGGLMEIAAKAVEEACPEYLRELAYDAEGSFLEGLDQLNLEVCFRDTLTASVQYTLLTRCGLDPSAYMEDEELAGITEFSTPAVLHHLGSAASTLSMEILQEIGKVIRNYDREVMAGRQKNIQKTAENSLAKSTDIGYTKVTEQFNTLKRESKERSEDHGRTDIQEERGLSDTGADAGRGGRTGGDADREVRDAAADLPHGEPSGDVHLHAADGEADPPLTADRRTGTGAGRPDSGRDDEAERSGREPERTRPDGVGAGGEQPDGTGGGSGSSGDRLQVRQEEQKNEKEQETAGDEPAVSAPEYFQISLFPTVEEQVERIAQAKEERKTADSPAHGRKPVPEVPKGVIGRALTSGGNEKNSTMRIAAFYQKSPSVEEAAAFLQKEYGTGGKGLTVAGEKYALWFDKEGIKIAPGRTANVPGATLVTWEQAAGQVSELLEEGIYATQEILDTARGNEYQELAAKLWYLRQDLSEEAVESGFLPHVSELYGGFPDSTEKIAGLLEEKESRDIFLSELTDFVRAYEADRGLMRFHFHNPQEILNGLFNLDIEPRQFHGMEGFEPAKGSFITEDEIDRMFMRGSGVSEGKMRIYSFFCQGHDAKERADFLKNEYGTGGGGNIGYDEWHDSKGIKFTRCDDASGFKGYDTVKMNWNQAQKRIGELIDAGRYLNPKEMAYTSEYEKIRLARSIYAFYFYCPNTPNPSNSIEWDVDAAERDFKPMLDDPKISAALYEDMLESFATVTPEESRSYGIMQRAIEDMGAYQRGEYSLFTPLPEETLRAERQKREAAKKEAKEKQDASRKEKEPLGELEAAARALAKKQKNLAKEQPGKVKERPDGQLTFDFMAVNEEDAGQADTASSKTGSDLEQIKEQEEAVLSHYDIGYGFLGNGLTVWNRLEEEHGDYKTVAHIDADRSVTFYDEGLPEAVKEQIRKVAAETQMNISATQETPVFSTPTQAEPEIRAEKDTKASPAGKSAAELYREALSMLSDVVRQSSFYSYLRDRETDYDSAAAELDNELGFFINEIVESQPDLYDAFQSLPMFRAWMVEDILERTYQDVVIDKRDAIERYAGEPDAPEWAKENDAPVQEKTEGQEEPAPVLEGTERNTGTVQTETDLAPNVEEYLNLKAEHPDKLVGVQVGEYILFYGKDAEAAAPALSAKLLTREIDGLGETSVTGGRVWQAVVKDLLEHGQSVVIARPDPERGENSPYEIVKERDIADYIPLGMKLTIDGRHMEVDSIDYEKGRVSLKDLDMQGWFPIFREESVPFVRECVEQEWENDLEHGNFPEDMAQAGIDAGGQAEEAHTAPEPEKDAVYREEAETQVPDGPELEEAKRLIEDFCLEEYNEDSVDFTNLEEVGIAYGTTENGGFEVQVNVDLIHFSLSQFVDGECVEKRQYDSLREMIDGELAFLDYDQLIYVEPYIQEQLEAGLNEKIWWEEMQGAREGVFPTEPESADREEEEPPELVEIEGGQVITAETVGVYSKGLPYEIVVEKLHTGPDRSNFRITDDSLGEGGQKTKYQNNIAAIRTLKQIEAENRLATPQEQEVLSKYVGWGGLYQAFDADNQKWGKEYGELKELLTPEEYESARSTVLNAHYTSPVVIKAMYEAVKRMGFKPGNILEPSCGIGNFFGLVPEEFEKSNLYGVELDSLTGRIAKQLYQKADITVGGFETTDHPNDFFDLAVGNVPFGEYKVHDRQYDKQNLLIHDYFLTKTLDKVRPGGVVAFITSKGTMDKANGRVREALAQKADLLGAVRLPNNAFKANAGTEVTADILFFQKRGSAPEKLPDWVNVGQTEDGVPLNNYYLQHPEMVLGRMAFWENMYGNATETACIPLEGADLKEQLAEAVTHIGTPDQELLHMDAPEQEGKEKEETIPADPQVRNFSFAEKDGKLYFRENSRMKRMEVGKMPAARIRGMIAIRDSARQLIDLQLNGADDAQIGKEQERLNTLYDNFQKKYGLLNSAGNRLAFRQDSSYPLLCSLEVLDEEGNLKRKADMFTKRTIQHRQSVTSVDTAVEALGVSIGERACVDLGFMASLMGGSDKIPQIISDLKGIIFKDPDSGPAVISEENTDWHKGWQTADEYLSGNVRKKLERAKKAAEEYPEFAANVEALTAVQPKDLTAPEISVRIGAPWIDTRYYRQFLFELLQTPGRLQNGRIDVMYSDVTGEWRIKGKSEDSITNTRVHTTYGTKRINAYEIFEASLNQRSVQIFDTHTDIEGKETRVLNEKETAIAQQKQDAMKEAFHDWIFKDPDRRADLCGIYNKLFNSTRPREYDGKHINFIGMNPEIKLEPHQRNAVARILYGGNSLLAHVVGAGKTYEMIAAAMESKRLGLCKKSIMVVPNHLTEQWGGDFLTLYPGAKVLVATKKDFEPKNRKKFCARIATGDYDAVIIGHSQFEKIPISPERQAAIIQGQIDEIVDAIAEAKANREEKFTVKQMEKTKKNLEAKIKKLYDKKKDDTVTFEELGVDRLFVDEAHSFKNLYMHTKMRNVAGISQTDAQKSSDMFAKCRYMDEITGGRGVVFATGTPVSNSMVELYTMMRYLQYSMLEEGYRDSTGKVRSLKHFDNWAATFGEQVTAVELKPEGTGFRLKTRFARFYNLPELINRWKEAADIQTADMLKLPVPEAEYITIQTEPSEAQKAMVQSLAERAEKIRKEKIDPRIDNMLKITSDGRKLALDQRIMNPLLPDDPGSKVNACVDNVFQIWQESAETKGTQLIFSDLSTPKGRAEPKKEEAKEGAEGAEAEGEAAATEEETIMEASVYEDIRKKLIAKGIPPQEIAFIHDANTEAQKAELFAKVRNGQVRVLLGSTQKMGAGTNVQTKLVASHDLDCPWRPADLEQRAGRIVRRGNENKKVRIFRYVTKGTFDAYTWGLVESKQKFIGQIMTSKSPARSIEDVDATALSYAEVKMLATGDARIKEKMDLDIQVTKLKMLKSNHQAQQYEMQDKVRGYYPNKIKETQLYIDCLNADLPVLEAHPAKEDAFSMTVMGTAYTERKEAGKAIVAACRLMDDPGKEIELGEYRGFPMKLCFDGAKFKVTMKQHLTHTAELSDDVVGNITRINNALEKIPQSLERHKENMARLHKELESAKEEAERPFAQEAELLEKSARLAELNTVLDNEEKGRGGEPAREPEEDEGRGNEKPSILKSLKEYERPAPVPYGAERGQEREAI